MSDIKHNTNLLCYAAKTGNTEEVCRLIPLSDPKARDSQALKLAASNGHTECVKLLIPVSGISSEALRWAGSEALRWAAYYGHTQCVELLIPVCNPKADGSRALQWAAERGHTECVKLLIPTSDPKEDGSRALQMAARHGHTPCVELLCPVSDSIAALNTLKQQYSNYPEKWIDKWIVLEQCIEAEETKRLRDALSNEVGEDALNRRRKM